MTRYYHACLTRAAYDYLRSRGITDAMIDSLQIGYVPDEPNLIYTQPIAQYAGVAKDGKSLLAGCVTFPYWQDDSVYNLRGRKITEKQYMSPYHSAYYRGADIIFRTDQAYHDTIILTESEIKAIASTQVGMPAYGFAGTNSSAVYVQYPRQTIIICFDNQRNHRRQLIQSIHRVAQRYTNVLIATLPLYGQEKQDIDDFIAQYGASEYRKVIQSAVPYEQWSALIR
jgi:DNA primase